MAQYLNLEEAVDYLIDETPEGAPFRDGADLCRLSERQRLDNRVNRRAYAVPRIIRLCKDGAWKATGKRPGSAEREHIPDIAFIDSKIRWHTGNLMATSIPVSTRLPRPPKRMVAIWTELRFTVPGGADEGKVAELPELKQDEGRPRDSEQAQPSRRDQRKAKTKAKYERWYQTARKFKSERKDDEPLRPIEIAKMVAKKEKAATNTEANPETIKRRLNENYQGWAD